MIQFPSRDGALVILDVEYITPADRALMLERCRPAARPSLVANLDALAGREAAWILAATDEQTRIGWGDHFRREPGGLFGDLVIYGRILTVNDFRQRERATGAPSAEIDAELRAVLAAYSRGWRYADCYSVIEPDGEPGDVHVAVMQHITPAEFEAARARGWQS